MEPRYLLTLVIVLAPMLAFTQSAAAPTLAKLQAVPFNKVEISDAFWAPRRETNRTISLVHSLDMIEREGNVQNFELAAKGETQGFRGPVFMDSDLYKVLESVSFSLAEVRDPELEKRLDRIIAIVASAQQDDGYLNTYYQVAQPGKLLTNLRDNHELYCAGHLFEAAVAHFQATGKRTLLDVATKYADFYCRTFGPGKRPGYCGHPEIELALVKLWNVTGHQRYFDLARFFVETRGSHFFAKEHGTPEKDYDGTYWQDDVPIAEHTRVKGHAVRAAYLLSGVVDVVAQSNDQNLLAMVGRGWRNCTDKNVYVTGGIGPSASNEGFTKDYDLPNLSAYQETCASVAMVMWNHRLNLLYGDAKYADAVETALFNGVLSGVSLDGKKFFYVNPLASMGSHHRSEWFGCACCPPNVTRTLASLGGYAYATSDDALWVSLYIQGKVQTTVGKEPVTLDVKTRYPWDGEVKIGVTVPKPTSFALKLRVPGWCEGARILVNGKEEKAAIEKGYLVVRRSWKSGDSIGLTLPMPVRRIEANPNVVENRGLLALARGPIVYALEAVDNAMDFERAAIPASTTIRESHQPDLLGGVTVLTGEAVVADSHAPRGLYHTYRAPKPVMFTAIPYYAWDNRAPGAMRVWMPTVPPSFLPGGLERSAKVTLSHTSGNSRPQGVRDGVEPKSSSEQPGELCHFWPRKGGEEWVQYAWSKPVAVSSVRVYWFDDTGRGECRLPKSWRLTYRDGETWKPVVLNSNQSYGIGLDQWFSVEFAPVTTSGLRLEIVMQDGWSVGVHEWQVLAPDEP